MGPRQIITAIALVLTLIAGIATFLLTSEQPRSPEPQAAMLLPESRPVPTFALIDQDGRSVDRDIFKGRWSLVFFGFTHCPDICPMTLQVLSDARRQLADAGVSPLPRIVLVSVDPERDTPDRIGAYVDYFGEDITGLTGELAEIRKLTDPLGIFFEKRATDDENYSVDHSTVVLLINPQGQFRGLFTAPHKASNFVNDLPDIMAKGKTVAPPLVVRDVVVTRSMPGMAMSAGYLTLANNTDNEVRITRITSPEFESVQMHETVIENDIATMREIPELVISAGSEVTFERGGKHLMLMRPTGDSDEVTLSFHAGDGLLLSVTTTRQPR